MKISTFVYIALISIISVFTYDNSPTINKILEEFLEKSPKELFKVWHFVFKKTYTLDSEEAKKRFKIFKIKLSEIKDHNSKKLPYKMALNQFSDLTKEEFEKKYLSEKAPEDPSQNFLNDEDDDDLTKRNLQTYPEINWVKYFPDVRDQGNCGSCWAFSTTGAIEGNKGIKANGPTEFTSPQQLVDCDKRELGCNGGFYGYALEYIKEKGLMYDKDYPYTATGGVCKYSSNAESVKVSGYKFCNNGSRSNRCSTSKVYALLSQGPLSVSVDASGNFGLYSSGVYTDYCRGSNHAVVLAGYGYDSDSNLSYWLIRNSWGANWGDKGYIKVAVNESNRYSCFITNRAFLPLVNN